MLIYGRRVIDQGNGTNGYCRYRQTIPVGKGGILDIDTNFGLRKSFLPQVHLYFSASECEYVNY